MLNETILYVSIGLLSCCIISIIGGTCYYYHYGIKTVIKEIHQTPNSLSPALITNNISIAVLDNTTNEEISVCIHPSSSIRDSYMNELINEYIIHTYEDPNDYVYESIRNEFNNFNSNDDIKNLKNLINSKRQNL